MSERRPYTPAEELANVVTHGLGAVLAVAGLVTLALRTTATGDTLSVVAVAVYGTSLIALYLSSTFYHAARSAPRKRLFRMFDHASIYTLIAGTYTPITLITLHGATGWTLFGVVWGLAILGVIATVRFPGRFKPLRLGVYIAMGWIVVFATEPLFAAMPTAGIVWLGIGGLLYTGGAAVYVWKALPFNHAIWHLFVLGGSVCHFVCILGYVLPPA